MVRSYEDVVDVRGSLAAGTRPGEGSFIPHQFLWRGRLYVVRDVLSHWFERSAWWEGTAAQAARGELAGPGPDEQDSSGAGPSAGMSAGMCGGLRGTEREVWRVEASAGRTAGSGVYDLCTMPTAASHPPGWRLLRVSD